MPSPLILLFFSFQYQAKFQYFDAKKVFENGILEQNYDLKYLDSLFDSFKS